MNFNSKFLIGIPFLKGYFSEDEHNGKEQFYSYKNAINRNQNPCIASGYNL